MEVEQSTNSASQKKSFVSLRRLSEAATAVGKVAGTVGEALTRTVASAGEILVDKDLRRKGAKFIFSEASKGLHEIQKGLQDGAEIIGRGIQQGAVGLQRNIKQAAGKSQLQMVMERLEKEIHLFRLREQLREQRQVGVDIQLGPLVYEDAPQEMRSRLWYVVLHEPEALAPLLPIQRPLQPGETAASVNPLEVIAANAVAPGANTSPRIKVNLRHLGESIAARVSPRNRSHSPSGSDHSPSSSRSRSPIKQQMSSNFKAPGWRRTSSLSAVNDDEGGIEMAPLASSSGAAASDAAPAEGGRDSSRTQEEADGDEAGVADGKASTAPKSAGPADTPAPGAGEAGVPGVEGQGEGGKLEVWEVVSDAEPLLQHLETPATTVDVMAALEDTLDDDGGRAAGLKDNDAWRAARQGIMRAISDVPWPIPAEYPEGCIFALNNGITVGQEEVDEIINRDINRTFPEHPLFGFQQGQQSLFRILKAYSLFDLTVGYCQGMAFAAGILLMYLPEELAFRLFCNLMDPTGPNLRRLYLPGLEPLKLQLATFDQLLATFLPPLAAHLREWGVPSVLYASQWFLTVYACPFPATFAARVIDVLLQDNNDRLMLRLAVSIMADMANELLELDDFEAIITYIKVQPLQWSKERVRRVMHSAIYSFIDDDALKAAEQKCIEEGHNLRLRHSNSNNSGSRASHQRSPSVSSPTAGGAAAAAGGEGLGTAAERASSLSTADSHLLDGAEQQDGEGKAGAQEQGEGAGGSGQMGGAGSAGSKQVIGGGPGSEGASHEEDFDVLDDDEYFRIVLQGMQSGIDGFEFEEEDATLAEVFGRE